MTDKLVALVERCLREVTEEGDLLLPDEVNSNLPLFGEDGHLDSLGLVSLVLAVEEAIEERYAKVVYLADQKALSQENSPYRTIQSLAEYAAARIAEG